MTEKILKEEKIGYLKSKLNLMQGTLYLTPTKLILEANKTGVSGLGLLGNLLKKRVEKKNIIFSLEFNAIKNVRQGKHGLQKNVLILTGDIDYKVIVKDYEEWQNELKSRVTF